MSDIAHMLAQAKAMLLPVTNRPLLEAEILLGFVLGVERVFLHAHSTQQLDKATCQKFMSFIQRRSEGEPIEYIIQNVSFYKYNFFISNAALIPRPETEILLQEVLSIIKRHNINNIAEVGVGSGAVICSLALECQHCMFWGSDISQAALLVAKHNIDKFNLHNIKLTHCAFLDKLPHVDLVYSNPPYIANSYAIPISLTFEPKEALFGGINGTEILTQLIKDVQTRHIRFLACEMGYDQKEYIQHLLSSMNIQHIKFYRDLAGLWRGFVVEF